MAVCARYMTGISKACLLRCAPVAWHTTLPGIGAQACRDIGAISAAISSGENKEGVVVDVRWPTSLEAAATLFFVVSIVPEIMSAVVGNRPLF